MAFITAEQIEETTDIQALKDWLLELESAAGKMEADLEFRSEADEEWEQRACSALGIARTRIKQITRRIYELQNGHKFKSGRSVVVDQYQTAVAKLKTSNENARLAAESSKRKLAIEAMRKIEHSTLNKCIIDLIRDNYDDETWTSIIERAKLLSEERAIQSIQSLAAE